jgi:uncharacterized integral membrane protein (TIGR00698 family)
MTSPPASPRSGAPRVRVSPAWLPGVLLAAIGAAVAFGIHSLFGAAPWLTAALVLGVIVGCVPALRPALSGVFAKGLTLSAKRLLRVGIVLLGLKLSLGDIGALGPIAIVAIVLLVLLSFAITWSIGHLFRLEGDQPMLLAAGFSICGVSAIGAVSAARNSPARDTGTPVALVTLYGTAAIVVLPALAPIFGLDAAAFGYWVGASVHDVGQVVATAQTGGAVALASAVVVKLTRVLTLAPMVAVISLVTRRRQVLKDRQSLEGGQPLEAGQSLEAGQTPVVGAAPSTRPPIVPLFIVGFIALVLVRSFLPVPEAVLGAADLLQTIFIAMALFAIGASLRLETLARSGLRAVGAGLLSWVAILGLGLGFVALVS